LLAIGLAGPQDRDVLDAPNLIEAHHAVEAFLERESVGIAETERLGREPDDPSAPLAVHPFDGDTRPFAARRIQGANGSSEAGREIISPSALRKRLSRPRNPR
jgi:hypothetical protein